MKNCIKALSSRFKPYVVEYFEIICDIFVYNPLPPFLYALETSVSEFGKVPDMVPCLTKVYEYISSATLNFINGKNLQEHDQLLEDFFGMLFRYMKYLPSVFLSSQTLDINLHVAELVIGIEQPNVEKTLYLFLEYVFRLCAENPQNEIEKVRKC